jgi:hypothetical protein
MARDLHNNIKAMRSVAAVAVGTTGTGQTGKVVDRAGYEGVEVLISYGSITATNATFTVTVKEGDATGTMTSVADADLLGSESNAGIAAGTPRTSGSNKNVVKRLGYIGAKRYVSASVKSTITAATPVSTTILLSNPRNAPVAT